MNLEQQNFEQAVLNKLGELQYENTVLSAMVEQLSAELAQLKEEKEEEA